MKTIKLTTIQISFVFFVFCFQKIHAQVGIGNTTPSPVAILEVENGEGNKGVLIPQVDITNLDNAPPINNPTESLLVFNTNTTTGEGFHYWDGSKWTEVGKREEQKGLQFYTYDYIPEEICGMVWTPTYSWCTIQGWCPGSNVIVCNEGWTNPPTTPNMLNPRKEDKSGPYTGGLNITQGNFAASGLKPNSNNTFIVKLVGYYNVQNEGDFKINSSSNGGVRLYIDEALVVDKWTHANGNANGKTVELAKGKHKFEFWYYDNTGSESFTFVWGPNEDGNNGILLANQFTLN